MLGLAQEFGRMKNTNQYQLLSIPEREEEILYLQTPFNKNRSPIENNHVFESGAKRERSDSAIDIGGYQDLQETYLNKKKLSNPDLLAENFQHASNPQLLQREKSRRSTSRRQYKPSSILQDIEKYNSSLERSLQKISRTIQPSDMKLRSQLAETSFQLDQGQYVTLDLQRNIQNQFREINQDRVYDNSTSRQNNEENDLNINFLQNKHQIKTPNYQMYTTLRKNILNKEYTAMNQERLQPNHHHPQNPLSHRADSTRGGAGTKPSRESRLLNLNKNYLSDNQQHYGNDNIHQNSTIGEYKNLEAQQISNNSFLNNHYMSASTLDSNLYNEGLSQNNSRAPLNLPPDLAANQMMEDGFYSQRQQKNIIEPSRNRREVFIPLTPRVYSTNNNYTNNNINTDDWNDSTLKGANNKPLLIEQIQRSRSPQAIAEKRLFEQTSGDLQNTNENQTIDYNSPSNRQDKMVHVIFPQLRDASSGQQYTEINRSGKELSLPKTIPTTLYTKEKNNLNTNEGQSSLFGVNEPTYALAANSPNSQYTDTRNRLFQKPGYLSSRNNSVSNRNETFENDEFFNTNKNLLETPVRHNKKSFSNENRFASTTNNGQNNITNTQLNANNNNNGNNNQNMNQIQQNLATPPDSNYSESRENTENTLNSDLGPYQQIKNRDAETMTKNNNESTLLPIEENELERNESNFPKNSIKLEQTKTNQNNGQLEPEDIQSPSAQLQELKNSRKKLIEQIFKNSNSTTFKNEDLSQSIVSSEAEKSISPPKQGKIQTQMLQNFQITLSEHGRNFNITSNLQYGYYPDIFYKRVMIMKTHQKNINFETGYRPSNFDWDFSCFYPITEESASQKILEGEKKSYQLSSLSQAYSSLKRSESITITNKSPKNTSNLHFKYIQGYVKGEDDRISIYFPLRDSNFNFIDLQETHLLGMLTEEYNEGLDGREYHEIPSIRVIEQPVVIQHENMEDYEVWFRTENFIILDDILQHRILTNVYWEESEILFIMQNILSCLDQLHRYSLCHLGLAPDNIVYTTDANQYQLINLNKCVVNHPENYEKCLDSLAEQASFNVYISPELLSMKSRKLLTLSNSSKQLLSSNQNSPKQQSRLLNNGVNQDSIEYKFNFEANESVILRQQRYSLGICLLIIKYQIPPNQRTHEGIKNKLFAIDQDQCLSAKIIKSLLNSFSTTDHRSSNNGVGGFLPFVPISEMINWIDRELQRPANEEDILPAIYIAKSCFDSTKFQEEIAKLYRKTFQFSQALEVLDELAAVKEAQLGYQHPEYLAVLKDRWMTLADMGRTGEAFALNQKWMDTMNTIQPTKFHYDDIHRTGEIRWCMNFKAEARQDFEWAQQLRVEQYGQCHDNTVMGYLKIASFYYNHECFDESIVISNMGLKLLKRQTKTLNLELYLNLLEYLAQSHTSERNLDQALETFFKIYKIKSNQSNDDSVSIGMTSQNIAQILFNQSDFTNCQKYIKQAISLCEPKLGVDDPNVQKQKQLYGFVLLKLGQKQQALPMFNQILDKMEKNKEEVLTQDQRTQVLKLANYFDSLTLLVQTAGYLDLNGETEEALRIYERCRVISSQLFTNKNEFNKDLTNQIANLNQKKVEILEKRYKEFEQYYIQNSSQASDLKRISFKVENDNQFYQMKSSLQSDMSLIYPNGRPVNASSIGSSPQINSYRNNDKLTVPAQSERNINEKLNQIEETISQYSLLMINQNRNNSNKIIPRRESPQNITILLNDNQSTLRTSTAASTINGKDVSSTLKKATDLSDQVTSHQIIRNSSRESKIQKAAAENSGKVITNNSNVLEQGQKSQILTKEVKK